MASESFKLTDALADQLAESVAAGVPIETACRAAGISERTFYNWKVMAERGCWPNGQPVAESTKATLLRFADLIVRAEARFEARRLSNIAAAAEAVNAKTGLTDWRADAWILNNHPKYRQTYRQHKEMIVEQTGTVNHAHELVKGMSLAELEALESTVLELPAPSDSQSVGLS